MVMTPSWRKLLCSLLVVLATTEQISNVAAAPLESTPPIEARAVKPHVNAARILAAAAAAVTPGYGRLGHMARREEQGDEDDDAWTTRSPYEQEQHLDVRAAVKPHVNAARILAAAAAAVTPGYGRFGHMAKREGELKHFPAVRKKKHSEDETEHESESEDESESETSKVEDKTKKSKSKSKTSSKASKTKTKSKKSKTSTHHSKATKSQRGEDDDDEDELVKRGGLSNFPTVAKISTRGIAARSAPTVKRRSVCSAKKVSSTSTSSSTAKTTSTSSTAKTSSSSTTVKASSTSKPVSTSTASSTTSKTSSTSTASSTATSKSSSTTSKASSTSIASTSSSTSSKSSSSTASTTSTKAMTSSSSTSSSTKASTSTASKTSTSTASTSTASTATATYGTTEASTDMAKIMSWAGATNMMNSTQKTETIAALLSAADRYFPELSRKDAVRYLLADINAESSFNVTAYNGGREDSGESLGLMQVSPSSGAQELPLFMGHNRVGYNNLSWSNTPGAAGPLLDYATGQQLVLSTLSRDDLFRPWVAIHLGSWVQSNLGRTASTDPYGWDAISAAQYTLLAAQNASATANATGTASQQSTAATKLKSAQAASDSALVGAGLSRSVLTGLGSWVAGPAVDGDSSYTGSGDDVSAAYFANIMAGVRVLYSNSSMTSDFLNGLVLTAGLVDYR